MDQQGNDAWHFLLEHISMSIFACTAAIVVIADKAWIGRSKPSIGCATCCTAAIIVSTSARLFPSPLPVSPVPPVCQLQSCPAAFTADARDDADARCPPPPSVSSAAAINGRDRSI
ncbi:hypothetical protein ACLOJK_037630 [Asimina triloba]